MGSGVESEQRSDGPAQAKMLMINPAVSVIKSTSNEVMVRFGSRSAATHRISDTETRGKLADFVLSFAEPSTAADIADRLVLDAETLDSYLDHLTAGNVLIESDRSAYSYLLTGLDLDPVPSADLDVVVFGQGRVAAATARQVGDLVGREVQTTVDLTIAFEESDFVMVCSDRLEQGTFYDADEYSRATDRPWHLTYVDGSELLVGPTFIPGVTTNYYERDTLDEAARVMRFDYQYLKTAQPVHEAKQPVPLFLAELAASYSTAALAQHLWGRGSFVEDHVLRIDMERMHLIRDRVMRLPRNPVSVASRSDLRHPFI